MVVGTLAFASLVDAAVAAAYVHVGFRITARPVAGHAALANRMFAVWWFALGANQLIVGLRGFAGAAGLLDGGAWLAAAVASHYVWILLLCIGLWGLLYYLTYLFTGSRIGYPLLGLFYALLLVACYGYMQQAGPFSITLTRWAAQLTPSHDLPAAFALILFTFLLLPQLVGAAAYGSLYFRVRERTLRYRIALVSVSLFVWLGLGLVAPFLGLERYDWWQLGARFLALGASLTILTAYEPPRWVRERFRIAPVGDAVR